MCFKNCSAFFLGFARDFLMSFLSAHNIILSRGQHVARELRVEQACSNICEFMPDSGGKITNMNSF